VPSSAPALRRRRWRSLGRRPPLDRLPADLLPARARARSSLPPAVPGFSGQGLRRQKLTFYGPLQPLCDPRAFQRHLAPARKAEWWVYAKPPFAGPEQVLAYVARYTHRVALSNNRLLDIEEDKVRFHWKDYRNGNRQKTMTLAADEFIRRFLLHVLPEGFQRIRYYGFLANRYRERKLARCRQLLAMPQPVPPDDQVAGDYRDQYQELTGTSLTECPACQRGRMVIIEVLKPAKPCLPTYDTS